VGKLEVNSSSDLKSSDVFGGRKKMIIFYRCLTIILIYGAIGFINYKTTCYDKKIKAIRYIYQKLFFGLV
jgi:hypothetical protein